MTVQLPKPKKELTPEQIARREAKKDVAKELSAQATTLEDIAARARVPQPLALDLLSEMARGGAVVAESTPAGLMFSRPVSQVKGATHLCRLDAQGAFCLEAELLPKLTSDLGSVTCKACRARLAKYPQARVAYEREERAAS